MALRNTWRMGDWLYVCQRCGFTRYASEIKEEWTGLRVCMKCWEPRHPQDYVRGVLDDQTVPYANPPTITFLSPGDVTPDDL